MHAKARESGDMPPETFLKIRCFEIEFCGSFIHKPIPADKLKM